METTEELSPHLREYQVTLFREIVSSHTVFAENEEDAKEQAWDQSYRESDDVDVIYSYVVDLFALSNDLA